MRLLDIIYIPAPYDVVVTSSSDRSIRGWRHTNSGFVLSTDFTDEQFLFEKEFPEDITSVQWDAINEILFCGGSKGVLYFYNIRLDLKNEMRLE